MTRVLTSVLFIIITFCYLYFYQADVMAVAQNVLSDGETRYNRTVGAVLITLALFLIGLGVAQLTKLRKFSYALNFFPSLLMLALMTDVSSNPAEGFSLGWWWLWLPLLLAGYAGLVVLFRQIQSLEVDVTEGRPFSRLAWANMLELGLMFLLVALVGNHSKAFHLQARMEVALRDGRVSEAVEAALKGKEATPSLTMLRAYALSRNRQMGEKLFEMPLVGGAKALRPDSKDVRTVLLGDSVILKGINWRTRYDYQLCACLLDRRIDDFARLLPKYYKVDANLPKHYREALVLYNHLRSNPIVPFSDAAMDADYEDYQQTARQRTDRLTRYDNLLETYGNTYWFYWNQ